jgi:tetratricopeptide (TPR) repeat protein
LELEKQMDGDVAGALTDLDDDDRRAGGEADERVGRWRRTRMRSGSEDHADMLAWSLAELGAVLRQVGLVGCATAPLMETASPGNYASEFSYRSRQLCEAWRDLGRDEEELAAVREALETFQRWATRDPSRHDDDIELYLGWLAETVEGPGRHEEALAATVEAVELRRHRLAGNLCTSR